MLVFSDHLNSFVDMYGMPNYNEFDPTPFAAITYTILFGIMFGDLGQGPCIAIVGFLMWKLKKMAIGKILIPLRYFICNIRYDLRLGLWL